MTAFEYGPRDALSGATGEPATQAADDLITPPGLPTLFGRADCCSAAPLFRILFPATPDRRRAAELLMCGHHYRKQSSALARLSVAVRDAAGRLVA